MLSSESQLELKRDVIVKAYETYSGSYRQFHLDCLLTFVDAELPKSSIPTIEDTVESPLLYGYRTKITPHFERPPRHIKSYDVQSHPDWLKIGFNIANSNSTLDIEVSPQFSELHLVNTLQECPIATSVLNERYKFDRTEIVK